MESFDGEQTPPDIPPPISTDYISDINDPFSFTSFTDNHDLNYAEIWGQWIESGSEMQTIGAGSSNFPNLPNVSPSPIFALALANIG